MRPSPLAGRPNRFSPRDLAEEKEHPCPPVLRVSRVEGPEDPTRLREDLGVRSLRLKEEAQNRELRHPVELEPGPEAVVDEAERFLEGRRAGGYR